MLFITQFKVWQLLAINEIKENRQLIVSGVKFIEKIISIKVVELIIIYFLWIYIFI